MRLNTLLSAVGYTEASSFQELCQGLGRDCPSDKEEWRDLFQLIREAETQGYVEVDRSGNSIDSIILTEDGKAVLKT